METVAISSAIPQPGAVVRMRNRLWRVNRVAGNVLQAVPLDGQGEERQFYLPFESLTTAEVEWPQAKDIGSRANQDLLLRAYQLVPGTMALGLRRVRMLLADDVNVDPGPRVARRRERSRIDEITLVSEESLHAIRL